MGSGEWTRIGTRRLVEDTLKIHVSAFKHNKTNSSGMLSWRNGSQLGFVFSADAIIFSYAVNALSYKTTVRTERLPCHYGGTRLYFRCPDCGTKRTALFVVQSIRCRECHNLTYKICNMGLEDRAVYHKDNAAARLDSGLQRPKNMHWGTYDRILDRYILYSNILNNFAHVFVNKMRSRIGRGTLGRL